MIIEPIVSEKALMITEKQRTYVFVVPANASKIAIARAIAERFKVKVATVNTVNVRGKVKLTPVQRGRRRLSGQRNDYKKAYVRLAEGEAITLFEEAKS
ncbi:50S ribosomal protein L23 [Candidatus Microgenomates bacterium]|nr:50S ribosomal protein L23 [Candidatus Microgenomates bacterium]